MAREDSVLLSELLESGPAAVRSVIARAGEHRVQVLYTRIHRDEGNAAHFESHGYRLGAEYFYPASTVKFPVALFALERLNQLGLPREAELRVLPASSRLPGNGGEAAKSVAQYAHEIFVVSDNDAYNRLYEFLGPQAIDDRLRELGLSDTRIVHRLSVAATVGENRIANASELWLQGQRLHRVPERRAALRVYRSLPLGESYIDATGTTVSSPFDFAAKNAFPLEDQQALLRELFFPQGRLSLSDSDRAFLATEMSMLPRESTQPVYPRDEYPDSYAKFLLAGGEASLPEGVTIYNKIGQAYGFTTDNAYVFDGKSGVEFLLSATIHTNENRRFNDDNYEYDEIAIPFLRELGRLILAYELNERQ
ncbi:MAG: serine hydrolase [Halieaceae bacterium]|nr:serine hydrolase [Halieaceae bacterium]